MNCESYSLKAKGSDKRVGCGNCSNTTDCHPCCRCVPESLCVIIDASASGSCSCSGCEPFAIACTGDAVWSETITCSSLTIDVTFTIEKEGEICYLFLASECLGLTGVNRQKKVLATDDGKCLDWGVTFDVDASDCGDSNCDDISLVVSPIKLIPNPQSERCDGCTNCRCFPYQLCIGFTSDNNCTLMQGLIDFDFVTETWTGTVTPKGNHGEQCIDPITVTVTPGKDEDTGKCTLALSYSGGLSGEGDVVVIDDETCPTLLSVVWEIGDDTITAASSTCLSCAFDGCCPNGIPTTLEATIENVDNLSAVDGLTVTLTYDEFASCPGWEGSVAVGDGCDEIQLLLCCDVDNECSADCRAWTLQVSLIPEEESVCEYDFTATLGTCECDPFEVVFSAIGELTGISTCDCADDTGSDAEISVTILEA